MQKNTLNQNKKQVNKSAKNSITKICKDIEVCQPSQTNGKGKPVNNVSGESTGKAYHHLVIVANEITVNGSISLNVSCFIFVLSLLRLKMPHNSVICRTKYPSPFPNYLIINSAQCAVSIYVPHILVKYIFFGALQQQFLFPCPGNCSTNYFPHQIGAQTLPVVWCNHKIHSFDKIQSRFVNRRLIGSSLLNRQVLTKSGDVGLYGHRDPKRQIFISSLPRL